MKIAELIKQLQDIMLIYGDKIILTITDDSGNEYKVKDITGQQCAKYFEPEDHVAEAIIRICRK